MIDYLIKVTLTWGLLLAVYELLYRKSTAFTLNRIYLFVALVSGLLLPLIPLPGFAGVATGLGTVNQNMQYLDQVIVPGTPQAVEAAPGVDAAAILRWLYLSGALVALTLSLREIVLILKTAVYGHYRTIMNYQIFSSGKQHAPFSFMGWVFISDPSLYDEEGLEYIFKHEQAHNRRWHWLDTLLIQLFFVVFWFHPLVWRYRYLLKLNHEFEADYYAAGNNPYEYGHFLLQQTLLKGTPAIAHSFHFSPIKNRINMLTRTGKKSGWKYMIVIPALLTCTLLFAKSDGANQRIRVGDKTTFQGHEFVWNDGATDTIMVENPVTGEIMIKTMHQDEYITRMDRDTVFSNENPSITQAQFKNQGTTVYDYVAERFNKKFPALPDSIRSIEVRNLVIDEKGKLSYFDLTCATSTGVYDLFQTKLPYAKELEKIITAGPGWLPALQDNKKIKVYLSGFNVYFKPVTIQKGPAIQRK